VTNPPMSPEEIEARDRAAVTYVGYGLWLVRKDGNDVRSFRTRVAAQNLANRLNNEITR